MDAAPAGDEPDPGSPADGTYEVQAGDTLSEIAERFSVPLDDLARWNDLADASRIRTGMVLVLNGEDEPEEEAADEQEAETEGEGAAPAVEVEAPVAVVEPPPAAPAVPAEVAATGDVHVVRAGETLSEIAAALGLRVADLTLANPGIDGDHLQPGQALNVPDVGGGRADDAVAADGGAAPEEFTTTYRVREGDSLWSIARRFGTSVRKLRSLNPELGAEGRLRPGQRLRVPEEER
jgi:membrane-bound lytic murein transglycosylase D